MNVKVSCRLPATFILLATGLLQMPSDSGVCAQVVSEPTIPHTVQTCDLSSTRQEQVLKTADFRRVEYSSADSAAVAQNGANAPDGQAARSDCYPALGTTSAPNYWIVSSRHCAQGPVPCCRWCHFEFYHVSGNACTHRSDLAGFQASLVPGIPVCIVAHGSFVTFPNVLADASYTYRWIRNAAPQLPLHIVFFTWPSEAPITLIAPLDIAILGQRSGFNGLYLSRLINAVPADHPVSLLGHSHGTRVVASALHLLSGGQVQNYCLGQQTPGRRIRAVLAAAAIDHNWLDPGERYGRALCSVECLLNLRNRLDVSLAFYPLRAPFAHRALARAGFTRNDRRRFAELNARVAQYDVTPLAGLGHMWPNYYRHPWIAHVIAPYLYFADSR